MGALLCHSLELVVAVCRCVCAVEVYMKKISEERWKERRKLLQGSCNALLVLKNPERECTDVILLIFFFYCCETSKVGGMFMCTQGG